MARIPEDEIERIKREVSLERLVEAQGIELKRKGKHLMGRCPWHEDDTPSLVITPETNLWNCLGACQTGGSVIDWVIKAHGVSFRHAVEILRCDQIPAAPARPVRIATVPKLPPPVDFNADYAALLDQVTSYYQDALKRSPEALAYLKERGITSPEIIERYRIGFANRTLGLRLPEKNRTLGADIRARLQNLGLLRESGHEHFNGSIVIPLCNDQGEVVGMYGRKITRGLRPGTPDHLYLKGAHRGVFNYPAFAQHREMILCEALIDALTFLNAGFPNVTSSYGVNGFTPEIRQALRASGTRRVLIAYDRDDAGDRAAVSLAEQLMADGLECFRIQFPRGMDANEYALKVTPAAKSLEVVIRKAAWMGKGLAPVRGAEEPVVEVTPAAAPPELVARPAAAPEPAVAPEPAPPPAPLAQQPPPASPTPAPAQPAVPVTRSGADVHITLGDRLYRIRNLEKNVDVGQLKVNVLVSQGDRFHVDTLDLYLARPRAAYCRDAALELGVTDEVIRRDLGHVLRALEELQDEQRKAALAPKPITVEIAPEARDEALALLKDPNILDRILADFRSCGVMGEKTNLLVGYLAMVSRLLDRPLAVVIQSSSAAGKSSLMEAVLAFLPAEFQHKFSAMTGQSLFYMGEADLKHKVLGLAEEEGAERASYALKLLQSEGELTIASTGKDPATGRHVTHEYRVEGPVMIFLTTTSVDIDEELLNRCVVLTVNENREQTRVIHQMQRERRTLEGQLTRRDGARIRARHQNAQRLLRPMMVINPYAPRLTFRDDQTRTRRDHEKYLTLIESIALLHQHQRTIRTQEYEGESLEYVEVTREDIRLANRLAHEVLGRSLDELPPQTRRLLGQLDTWVRAQCESLAMTRADFRFQRRDLRALAGLSEPRARQHLDRLVALEYVIVHRGERGQSFVYELVYDGQGQDGQVFLLGLIDPDSLDPSPPHSYEEKFVGSNPEFVGVNSEFVGSSSGHRRPIVGGSSPSPSGLRAAADPGSNGSSAKSAKNTVLETGVSKTLSYPQAAGPRDPQ